MAGQRAAARLTTAQSWADSRPASGNSPRSVRDPGSVICPPTPPEQTNTTAGPRLLTNKTSSR
jgi:hypothetical protein